MCSIVNRQTLLGCLLSRSSSGVEHEVLKLLLMIAVLVMPGGLPPLKAS
jgi:hypothetical protein